MTLTGTVAEPPWRAIEKFAPEACVHAAWIATPGVYLEASENHDWFNWSESFLVRLAQLGVRHLSVLGTCIEYQITGRPLSEELTPLLPTSTYAQAKCELRRRLGEGALPKGTTLAWARVFYPYGEGEHSARLASSLIVKLRRGEPVTLKTPHSTKDYIHVDDVASALMVVVGQRFAGTVNVGTGVGVTVETIAREIGQIMGRPDLITVPDNPPIDPLDYVVADVKRLRSLGWRPQVPLAAGLRRLVEVRAS